MQPKTTVPMKRQPTPWPRQSVAKVGGDSLVYHNGPLLANVEVTTIYWGSAWASDPLRTQLDEFFGFLVTSSLVDQLSEYSVPGFTIGHGRHVQSVLLTDDPGATLDDLTIQARLDALLADGTIGPANPNSLFMFFTASGVTVTAGGDSSCAQFCGYHNLSNSGVVYAVDPYDDCPGCQFVPGDLLGSSTIPASHEFCEAITDPHLDGWFSDQSGEEIGDLCAGQPKVINASGTVGAPTSAAATTAYTVSGAATADAAGNITASLTLTPVATPPPPPPPPPPPATQWTVQTEWSNAAGSCV